MCITFEFFSYKTDPGPGNYSPQELTKPEATVRPPFGSTAERFDRHARRFFLGSTVRLYTLIGRRVSNSANIQ